MTFHLHVADGLAPLAERLAGELARPLTDPFAAELVAVPGDGVRAWLTAQLGRRVGAADPAIGDGIVANVEFVFPGALVRRALGEDDPDGPWSVGHLTWAIHEVIAAHGSDLGLAADAVRAREIADLFDRYSLHRTDMVRAWERGSDIDVVGQPLPAHVRWQPRLWRLLVERIGHESDATDLVLAAAELKLGRRTPLVPERVFLFGLASLPLPHLHAISALASQRDVHVFTPVASLPAWERVRAAASEPIVSHVPRSSDPSASAVRHPLAATWGRAAREAQLLLTSAAVESSASVTIHRPGPDVAERPALLATLQRAIRADTVPPGPNDHGRVALADDDRSVQWHRCHGRTRQVEVLRDVIVRLLEQPAERPLEPREIVVLTPDVAAFAPIVEAVFAGDPDRGVPPLPVRVADRTMRQDNPVMDAVAALLELVGGRFRVSDVLAFAARAPVRRRFGFGPDELGRLAEWVDQVHVRWGLDPDGARQFGLPDDVTAFTWRSGLDQLLTGAAMAAVGPRFGPGDVVPYGDVEGDDVDTAGSFADLIERLGTAHRLLCQPQPVATWCSALGNVAADLLAVPDADSWQWRDLRRVLGDMAGEAEIGGEPTSTPVPPRELATLLTARLTGRAGRAAFMSGAITLSSLTAQRGVPHRVVCLLGVDGDLGASTGVAIDDLMLAAPCVGDRDARSELRAQLLDAVLAAEETLVLCTTGRDIRTNAHVPPSVPVAELVDLIDATATTGRATVRASEAIAVDHPRQPWSEPNFRPGELGVASAWSFDRGALAAATVRRRQGTASALLAEPLVVDPSDELALADLLVAVRNPYEAFFRGRLGMRLDGADAGGDDLIPLDAKALDGWRLADDLLVTRLLAGASWDDERQGMWEAINRATGAIPPLDFGRIAVDDVTQRVDAIAAAATAALAASVDLDAESVAIEHLLTDGRRLTGVVGPVQGQVLTEITASRLAPKHLLATWVRLAALVSAHPDQQWSAVSVGRGKNDDTPRSVTIRFASVDDARRALDLAVDLHRRAHSDLVPMMPATALAIHRRGVAVGAKQWSSRFGCNSDRWVDFAHGVIDLHVLLAEPPRSDEVGDDWGPAASRIERWAYRIWSTVAATIGDEALEVFDA